MSTTTPTTTPTKQQPTEQQHTKQQLLAAIMANVPASTPGRDRLETRLSKLDLVSLQALATGLSAGMTESKWNALADQIRIVLDDYRTMDRKVFFTEGTFNDIVRRVVANGKLIAKRPTKGRAS